ncbi:MAG TPA: LPS export ABC transporter permease LptF [Xanthobacteraceae bacterium]|nr:LPS export ABC transporter permease LptF [Xanthobacteraceae bacterium]
MGRLDRYILVTAGAAFIAALSTLTGMVWLTQILRRFDLVTSQGQTILVFFTVTGLALPTLVLLTAPISLFLAIAYTLNRFSGDSELIVMSAAGYSQWQLFRPLLIFSLFVTAVSAVLSLDGGPLSVRMLREQLAKVNADIINNVAQPGRFAALDRGLTVHIRERASGGILRGIFVHDSRDPKAITTYIADRGQIVSSDSGIFLVLEDGTMHRAAERATNASMVEFKNYAFDMSQFNASDKAGQSRIADRPLLDLLWPPEDDPNVKPDDSRIRVELHKRLSTPLYPLAAFIIPFAFLGTPQTTRQNRNAAIAAAGFIFMAIEIAGFGTWGFVQRNEYLSFLPYLVPLAAIVPGLLAVAGLVELRMPSFIGGIAGMVTARLERMQTA